MARYFPDITPSQYFGIYANFLLPGPTAATRGLASKSGRVEVFIFIFIFLTLYFYISLYIFDFIFITIKKLKENPCPNVYVFVVSVDSRRQQMMKIKFKDHYTQVTSYFGAADGHKFAAHVKYNSMTKNWLVTDVSWLLGDHPKKDKAEKRITKLVEGFFKRKES